jgi:hypothetical protein
MFGYTIGGLTSIAQRNIVSYPRMRSDYADVSRNVRETRQPRLHEPFVSQ